jgi:hypothetical protein
VSACVNTIICRIEMFLTMVHNPQSHWVPPSLFSTPRWGGRRSILCWVPYKDLTSTTVHIHFPKRCFLVDRFCGLVFGVPGYRSRGPDSIPALPDFLRNSGSGTGSVTMVYQYNYHNPGYYPSSCVLFKTQLNSVGLSIQTIAELPNLLATYIVQNVS